MASDDDKKKNKDPNDVFEDEVHTAVETVEAKRAADDRRESQKPAAVPAKGNGADRDDDDDEDDDDEDDEREDEDDEREDASADDEDEREEASAKTPPPRAPAYRSPPAHDHDDHGFAHVIGVPLLGAVLGALLVLTIVTVAVTAVDLGGQWNLVVALVIAVIKASLVVMFFMHLLWDKKFNLLVFMSSVLFVILFLSLALTDRKEYQHLIDQRESAMNQPSTGEVAVQNPAPATSK